MKFPPARILLRTLVVAIHVGAVSSCDGILEPDELAPTDPSLAIPPAQSHIEVTPAGPLSLMPGDTVTLRVIDRTGGVGSFVFASSDSTIASVREGRVTGLRPGTAQVTVSLRSDPQIRTALSVIIRSRGPSSVRMDRLEDSDKVPVDVRAIGGELLTHFRFRRGDAVAVEVIIDSVTACLTPLSRTAIGEVVPAEETGVCAFDTASFDTISGAALFRNGPAVLSARLIGGDGKIVAGSGDLDVRLANRDTMIVNLVPEARALDALGRPWIGGNVTVEAFPVLYGEDRTQRVTFRYKIPHGRQLDDFDTEAPYRATFTRESLAGSLDERFRVTVASTLESTASGPAGESREIGYDGVPPAVGFLAERDWIGATLAFSSLYAPPDIPDRGVGRVAPIFFAGAASHSATTIFASGARIAVGGELNESGPGMYRLAYRVCDALQNCVGQGGFTFGVDLTAPTLAATNLPQWPVNPAADLWFELEEDRSGLPERPLLVAVQSLQSGMTAPTCGPTIEVIKLPGTRSGGACVPEATGNVLSVPRSREGYYFYSIAARDRAGNQGEIPERIVLIDAEAPEILSFNPPAQYTPGQTATLQAQVADNVDLATVDFRLVFGTGTGLPFSGRLQAGRPFSGTLSPSFAASATLPFVRTLTRVEGASRSTALVSAVQARVVDAAGLATVATTELAPGAYGGNVSTSDPFPTVSTATVSTTAGKVCALRCLRTDPSTVPVTLQVVGDAGLSAFSRMHLFARGPDGIVTHLASTASFAVVETGTQRTYKYSFDAAPPAGAVGVFSIFGVAVNSSGNALKSTEAAVEFYTR